MTVAALLRSRSGNAAAEMALVTPLLVLLLFGSAELGKFFLDEHVVIKAVRDGARYAARQPMSNFVSSSGCQTTLGGTVAQDTRNLVRTGGVSGTNGRLYYWNDNATVRVVLTCNSNPGGQPIGGIYSGIAGGAPVVEVTASVPYVPLFGVLAFRTAKTLNASQQAAVTGV